jgi:beta-lactamase regulating signal transducer with metallopeptidase domain
MAPAVVGFLRGRVVIPRWAMEAGAGERAMMVRHETEHLAGRDPQLLLFALALLIAMPWNLPLWYMVRRLRLAVEVDCDRRVLAAGHTDVRAYGTLLMSVGQRRSTGAFPVAAFSRPRSLLEHRIDRMTAAPAGGAGARALAAAALVVGVLAVVWWVPQPVRAADTSGWFEPCDESQAPVPQPDRWPGSFRS